MAERPRGNLLLELAIVALTLFLLFTILYPKATWKKQAELQSICRARIEATQQVEFQYMNLMNTYEDTLDSLMKVVCSDSSLLMGLDTTVNWDGIVAKDDLEKMVLGKSLPEDLRSLIDEKIGEGRPLGRLAKWDSLEYRLIDSLKTVLSKADTSELLDNRVDWRRLVGESGFWDIYEAVDLPTSVKNSTRKDLRKDVPIQTTKAWNKCRPAFLDTLADFIQVAEMKGVWEKDQKEDWEMQAKAEWLARMDAMSETDVDSIWRANQDHFWDRDKEQIWSVDRKKLWKKEGDAWKEANKDTWMRLVEHEWELRTKKEWTREHTEGQPDTVLKAFEEVKDSLWRVDIEILHAEQFEKWRKKEKKYEQKVIDDIWEIERKATWEPQARQKWVDKKNKEFDKFWIDLKEGMWNDIRTDLWLAEEKKLTHKQHALNVIDQSILWREVVPGYADVVNSLKLPDNKALWEKIRSYDVKKGSALVNLGVSSLFRDVLLDSIALCPEIHLPYLIDVEDTTTIKKVSIACPIQEKEFEKRIFLFKKVAVKRPYCVVKDPATGEPVEKLLKPGFFQKVFGARVIEPHGEIDKEGKKSWVKKGS
ncbi:hypothetical protein JW948_11855 [bacterium]|nr:hypothetical protein [bacterium]